MTTKYTGQPLNRVDGAAKVTGAAKYSAENNVPGLVYGYVVSSAITRGKITSIDTSATLALPGVLQVFTHENRPHMAMFDASYQDEVAPPGKPFRPFFDAEIQFSQQPVALVVAEEFEIARYAASLVRVEYEKAEFETDLHKNLDKAAEPKEHKQPPPKPWGKADKAFAAAPVRHQAEYVMAPEHHNPMELFATTAVWETGGKITIYEKTQGVHNTLNYITKVFNLAKDRVQVLSPFVGGAFGLALRPQYQLVLAVMAALELKRPVKVSLTRQQMFSLGYRPHTWQRISLGATEDDKLEAVIHEVIGNTSQFEDYEENVTSWAGVMYQTPNAKFSHKLLKLDLNTSMPMRAPGGATGVYALEAAMDELAYELEVDPLELRLKNEAQKDQNEDIPFSSNQLRECYRQGAEKFGWSRRSPQPRSMRQGHQLIGWGVAAGLWEAMQQPASAKAKLTADGKLEVSSGTADIGTGTYTVMTQLAAETLGLPIEDVSFKLGDSDLPQAPDEGGSSTASTVGSAVYSVCQQIGRKLLEQAAKMPGSPFAQAKFEEVTFTNGQLQLANDSSKAVAIKEILSSSGLDSLEEMVDEQPDQKKQKSFSRYTHSAVFAEVRVDEDFGTVQVTRVVNAVAAGRILNPKTAANQVAGGVVWGIGMALQEESLLDHNFGRFVNHNLAEYHVPVNADIHDIDVIFVEEHDEIVNPIGVKGLGEIGVVGTAAAIANAIYHATGKRVRDLPITLDKLI